jgi:TPR repeat protein
MGNKEKRQEESAPSLSDAFGKIRSEIGFLDCSGFRRNVKKIIALAEAGCLDASRFLRDTYSDGVLVEKDEYLTYKYACYAALQGDLEQCWQFYLDDRIIMTGFAEDDDTIYDKHTVVRYYERKAIDAAMKIDCEETLSRLRKGAEEGNTKFMVTLYKKLEDKEEASAWLEKAIGTGDPFAYCVKGIGKIENEYGEDIKDPDYVSAAQLLHKCGNAVPEAGRALAELFYYGKGVERDDEKALEHALYAAEAGHEYATKWVIFLTGHIMPSDSYRGRRGRRGNDLPDRLILEDSLAWQALKRAGEMNQDAYTGIEECMNEYGGFENKVFRIWPFFWGRKSECPERFNGPNFVFKPTGLEFCWYNYPWRDGTISERLSVGEIKHVWRLCIDSIREGVTFDDGWEGDTRSFLKEHPFRSVRPAEMEERISNVLRTAKDDKEEIHTIIRKSLIDASWRRK